jgi:ABC-type nickel/cobalt efflux system permease component RcnA
MATLAACLAGLMAGILHTVLGPDHLAAVAVFSADKRNRSGRAGFIWGLGHTAGALAVGVLALAFGGLLRAELYSSLAERMVGLILAGMGAWGLWRVYFWRTHQHGHQHGDTWHEHHHVHEPAALETPDHPLHESHAGHVHAAFGVGMLSGLAGGSHILAVSPALAMPTMTLSAAYLGMFALGSIASMTIFSMTAGAMAARLSGGAERGFFGVTSAVALLVGVVWLAA